MEARVAAIRAGDAPELVWLLEHPPLYTAGTSARADDLLAPAAFPGVHAPAAAVSTPITGRASGSPTSCSTCSGVGLTFAPTSGRLEEWVIRTLASVQRPRRAARGPGRHLGSQTGRSRGGQDRGDRRPYAPLGDLPWGRGQPRPRPRALCRHRALRHPGLRRHLAGRPRADGQHGRARQRAAARVPEVFDAADPAESGGNRSVESRKPGLTTAAAGSLDDPLDPGRWRALATALDHRPHGRLGSRDQCFDRAVPAVAHPARQAALLVPAPTVQPRYQTPWTRPLDPHANADARAAHRRANACVISDFPTPPIYCGAAIGAKRRKPAVPIREAAEVVEEWTSCSR